MKNLLVAVFALVAVSTASAHHTDNLTCEVKQSSDLEFETGLTIEVTEKRGQYSVSFGSHLMCANTGAKVTKRETSASDVWFDIEDADGARYSLHTKKNKTLFYADLVSYQGGEHLAAVVLCRKNVH